MSIKLINGNENPGIMKKIILLLLFASIYLSIQSCSDSTSAGSSQAIDTEIILTLRYFDDQVNPKLPDVTIFASIHCNYDGLAIFSEEKKVASGQSFWKIYEDPYRLAAGDILEFIVMDDNRVFAPPEITLQESDFYYCDGGDEETLRELGVSFTASYNTVRDEFDFRVYIYGNVERELRF